jgi:hypothetical protein
MAMVSTVPAITHRADSIRVHDIGVSRSTSNRQEIEEEPVARMIDDKIYVAVGKEVKESKSTVVWALQNSGGKKVCIILVHSPAQMIPLSKSAIYSHLYGLPPDECCFRICR